MGFDKIVVSVAFWTNFPDLIATVRQKLSFIMKNSRGGKEEAYFIMCKKFTELAVLAVIDKDLRGIYSNIDVSSSIAHASVF